MGWLKHVWLDLVVTLVIVVAAVQEPAWAIWAVWIYTPVMLVLKLLPLAGGFVERRLSTGSAVPAWFYHVLYAVNAGILLAYGWWIVGAGWLGIWLLSALADRRRSSSPGS